MNLLTLAFGFLVDRGRQRAIAVTLCTAVVSGLILVSIQVLRFGGDGDRAGFVEPAANLLRDGGVRPGFVFALLMFTLIPLTLLQQVVRLGTTSRERRLAGLRIAGATPGQVRVLGAIEVGLPAFTGGLLGWLVYLALRGVFGGAGTDRWTNDPEIARELRMVPTSVTATWWQVLAVAVFVGACGAAVGAFASRDLMVSPHGLTRGVPQPAPRPWAAMLLVGGGAFLIGAYVEFFGSWFSTGAAITGIALLVVGVLLISPWVAYRMGRAVADRASSPALLVAARRLATDPRPAARAAAATGAIALVAGGAVSFLGSVVVDSQSDPIYVVPGVLVLLLLLVSLAVTVFSLAVHSVESLMDRRRSFASLAAEGVPIEEIERIQRWESALVALPVSAIALLLSTVGVGLISEVGAVVIAVQLVAAAAFLGLIRAAVNLASRIVRPWLRRATAPENLRTA